MLKRHHRRPILRTLGRIGILLLTTLLLLVLFLYMAMWMLVKGPSPTICRLFVNSVKETSAGGFLADMYLSAEEIAVIRQKTEIDFEEEMDPSLIVIPGKTEPPATDTPATEPAPTEPVDDGIEVVDIVGRDYHGKLMIVSDPTRVFVGVPGPYGSGYSGMKVDDMIKKYGAVAGINAGGFYDPNGNGTGGIPDGIVISDGELLWGGLDSTYDLAGLDGDGRLYVGKMTARKALSLGIRYAASYGPALITNGSVITKDADSLNPRTAIGQRADGAILLLVIEGRSISSLGASLADVTSVMLDYGAVNATNMDGGSSSIMIHNGEYLTNSSYIFGIRVVATAFLVK